jgi:opacity protein-like surface antigen
MRSFLMLVIGTLPLGGVAYAQPAGPAPSKGYTEVVAQSAFGNVTSQSFGGEIGVTVLSRLQVFVDAGRVRDASPSDLGTSAQTIAAFLSQTQGNAAYRVKEPVTFGLAGVRYGIPTGKVEPYLLGGGGVARVRKDVTFTLAGNDVTSSLQQYGVVLGGDLSGSETRPMLTVGGGVAWAASQHLIVDFQYRYGRVFASDRGLNVNRAGIGIGVRF